MNKQRKDDERAEELLRIISDIEEEMIREADFENKNDNVVPIKSKKKSFKRWIPIAACFVILMVAAIPFATSQLKKSNYKTNDIAYEAVDEGAVEIKSKTDSAKSINSDLPTNATFNAVGEEDNSSDVKVLATIDSYSFTDETPWINVMWINGTDEAITVIPKFDIVRIGDYDTVETIILTEDEITFPEVRYTVEADENFLQAYRFDRSIYDISKPGHYRLYLYIAEQEEPIYYLDFELS